MLINNYGEEICFTYPKDKKNSQMFLSSKVFAGDVAEKLRCNDPVQMCAKILKSECVRVCGTRRTALALRSWLIKMAEE